MHLDTIITFELDGMFVVPILLIKPRGRVQTVIRNTLFGDVTAQSQECELKRITVVDELRKREQNMLVNLLTDMLCLIRQYLVDYWGFFLSQYSGIVSSVCYVPMTLLLKRSLPRQGTLMKDVKFCESHNAFSRGNFPNRFLCA